MFRRSACFAVLAFANGSALGAGFADQLKLKDSHRVSMKVSATYTVVCGGKQRSGKVDFCYDSDKRGLPVGNGMSTAGLGSDLWLAAMEGTQAAGHRVQPRTLHSFTLPATRPLQQRRARPPRILPNLRGFLHSPAPEEAKQVVLYMAPWDLPPLRPAKSLFS